MTSEQPQPAEQVPATGGARRGPRRAVRLSDTVGTDESVLRSTLPAAPAPQAERLPKTDNSTGGASRPSSATDGRASTTGGRGSAAALARLLERDTDLGRSADDSDRGWGDGADTNDDRLARDRPPHW